MPTFNDLYYTDIGNKYLKPEFTEQYNVGAVYNKMFNHNFFKYFNIQADGYYNKVTNKIIAYPTGQQFRWTMLNLGEVRIIGVDVAAQLSCQLNNVGIHARLNYTWQKAQDYTDPTDYYYKHQIPYIPWHSGSAIVSLEYGKWNLNYSFIYTGERYRQQMNSVDNYEQPWYTSDLALSRDIPVYKVNMNVTAEVNNIFNQYYDVVANFPMPGINYKLILRITI
ncbi:MAG: TonB-dependent receptor domain-containing protein [Barnesiella sp.]